MIVVISLREMTRGVADFTTITCDGIHSPSPHSESEDYNPESIA